MAPSLLSVSTHALDKLLPIMSHVLRRLERHPGSWFGLVWFGTKLAIIRPAIQAYLQSTLHPAASCITPIVIHFSFGGMIRRRFLNSTETGLWWIGSAESGNGLSRTGEG